MNRRASVLPGVPPFRGKVLGVTQSQAFGSETTQLVVADEITRGIVVVPTNLVRSWTET